MKNTEYYKTNNKSMTAGNAGFVFITSGCTGMLYLHDTMVKYKAKALTIPHPSLPVSEFSYVKHT